MSKFKVGDKIRCLEYDTTVSYSEMEAADESPSGVAIQWQYWLKRANCIPGHIYTVSSVVEPDDECVQIKEDTAGLYLSDNYFELASKKTKPKPTNIDINELSLGCKEV